LTAMRHAASRVDFREPEEPARKRDAVSDVRQLALEWPVRAFFGALLAAIAIAAIFAGRFYFASFLALVALAASREWHRLVSGRRYALETCITAGSIAAALAAVVIAPHSLWPICVLAAGSLLAAGVSFRRGMSAVWSGSGAIYLGVPALCLTALRMDTVHGSWVLIGLFITIWAADTGAFICGRFLGGPKFVPALSPNKTWSGIAGGIVLPAASLAVYVALLGGNAWKAGLLGAVLAAAGHTGDLFESWVKRRVGRKNSGSLIPGHGGVLDRIDSTLFVAPLAAVLVFVFGLDLLFGAHP
jgi:phosphatidate cytidylyltransferase